MPDYFLGNPLGDYTPSADDTASAEDDRTNRQRQEGTANYPLVESLSKGLSSVDEFLRSGKDSGSPLARAGTGLAGALGLDSLSRTLHRAAYGDKVQYTPEERRQAGIDNLVTAAAIVPGLKPGASALRTALERAARATAVPEGLAATRIFAGPMAETADLGALRRAQDLHDMGVDPQYVWKETGWFRGPEGKWRHEIDDSTAVWRAGEYRNALRKRDIDQMHAYDAAHELRAQMEMHGVPLHEVVRQYEAMTNQPLPNIVKEIASRHGSKEIEAMRDAAVQRVQAPYDVPQEYVLRHHRLHEAYPDLKEANVSVRPMPERVLGSVDPASGDITMSSRHAYGDEGKATVLHEVQHAIQAREGFDPGDNPERIASAANDRLRMQWHEDIQNVRKAIEVHKGNMAPFEPEVKKLVEAYPKDVLFELLEKMHIHGPEKITPEEAQRLYYRAGGEVESRVVEGRRHLTAEQRKERFPMIDYDLQQAKYGPILLKDQR